MDEEEIIFDGKIRKLNAKQAYAVVKVNDYSDIEELEICLDLNKKLALYILKNDIQLAINLLAIIVSETKTLNSEVIKKTRLDYLDLNAKTIALKFNRLPNDEQYFDV